MASDEHGMPVPHEESPLPWKWIGSPDFPRATMILSESLNLGEVGEIYVNDDNDKFVQHAVNSIIECRRIVRRLAEWDKKYPKGTIHGFNAEKEHDAIAADAAKLWAKMRENVKGGDGDGK